MRNNYKTCMLIFFTSMLVLYGCTGTDGGKKDQRDSAQETESALPAEEKISAAQIDFEAQDMDGNTVTSAVFQEAKLTMVNVWATYCNPCLNEMPELGELAGEYDSDEFQIIGIISDVMEDADQETIELAKSLIEQTGASYTHCLLSESLYYALLTDVAAVPTTFFIDENGEVIDTVVGAMDKSAWEERINALLEEQ